MLDSHALSCMDSSVILFRRANMKPIIKRLLSGVLSSTMTISAIPIVSAHADESAESYPYTMFAASNDDGAITINADNFCVNGNVATNGTIVSSGNMNINGTKTESADESMIFIFDKIDTKYFSVPNVEEHTEDYTIDELNININVPTEVQGEATLTGNININNALKALDDVNLYGEVKNTNDSIIFSKYGDIVIDSQNVNLNGLIYAPFGSVTINAQNLNLNNVVIIAESIVLTCPNVNANNGSNASSFVGTSSEIFIAPIEEWQYLNDNDEDGIPDLVENAIGTDNDSQDSDGDNIPDYTEYVVLNTDPTSPNDVMPFIQAAYDNLEIELAIGDTYDNVNNDVVLPLKSTYDAVVEWEVSNDEVININGHISDNLESSSEVTYTATIFLFGEQLTKKFDLHVNPKASHIDIDSIKDLTVDDIEEMNSDDEDFEIEINDYGYIEEIFGKYSDNSIKSPNDALYSLYSIKTALGISDPFEELKLFDIDKDETGTIYKFTQLVNGVPCFDNNIIVSCDENGTTDYLRSSYFPVNTTISTSPNISYEDINDDILKEYPDASIIDVDEDNRLFILNYYGKLYLVWNKYIGVNNYTYQILVNANDGKILYKNISDINFDEDLTITQDDLLKQSRTISILKQNNLFVDDYYYLEDSDRNIIVYDAQGKAYGSSDKKKYKETSIPVYYNSSTSWTAEEISAMANMEDIYDFYNNKFSRLSFDDAWTKTTGNDINVYINTGIVNNACWSPSIQSFIIGHGDGSGSLKNISLAAGSDVLCHEFTHAVTEYETSLDWAYFGTAGAIDEAYSDIMACIFDGNWTIGEDVAYKDLRNIRLPSISGDGYYPSYFGDYSTSSTYEGFIDYKTNDYDYGGVHLNSTVISHSAYLMSKKGLDQDKLGKLCYKSLCMGYGKHSDFYDVRQNVTKAAKKLKFTDSEKEIIRQSFDEVKIDKSCEEDSKYFKYADSKTLAVDVVEDNIAISGMIVEATQSNSETKKGICNVDIALTDNDDKNINNVISDINGMYETIIEHKSGLKLELSKEGYIPETYYVNNIGAVQKEVYCDTIELISISDSGKGGASGKIISASTGVGVAGLTLNLRKGINNIYTDVITESNTSSNGTYSFNNIEAGNYTMEIVDNSSRTEKYITTYVNIKVMGGKIITDQNGVVSTNLEKNQVRIVLTWGIKPNDLDSHMLSNNIGNIFHVYYGNKTHYDGEKLVCMLDLDDITSFGPETTTLYNPNVGVYQFYIHNYSGEYPLSKSNACVKVYLSGDSYPKYTFNVPEGSGRIWDVFCYNSATKTVTAINSIR